MTIELNQKQERLLHKAMKRRDFHSVDEALDAALRSILPADASGDDDGDEETVVLSTRRRHTPAEAGARILELRKGVRLPEGMTIRSMIDEGRA